MIVERRTDISAELIGHLANQNIVLVDEKIYHGLMFAKKEAEFSFIIAAEDLFQTQEGHWLDETECVPYNDSEVKPKLMISKGVTYEQLELYKSLISTS